MSLEGLFRRKSANTQGFILAVLVSEGVIALSKEKQRCFVLQDLKPFLDAMEKLQENGNSGSKTTSRRKQQSPAVKKSSSQTNH